MSQFDTITRMLIVQAGIVLDFPLYIQRKEQSEYGTVCLFQQDCRSCFRADDAKCWWGTCIAYGCSLDQSGLKRKLNNLVVLFSKIPSFFSAILVTCKGGRQIVSFTKVHYLELLYLLES